MDIGRKINKLRIEKGMTLEELGDMVGVGKSTVRKWETGAIANMKRDKILRVSEALNTTPAYLMGWECDEPSQNKITDLSNQTIRLINDNIEKLNNNGQKKLLDYSEILVGNPDYVEDSTPILNAAHARTDIKQTPEGKAHDDAIMMDPKEWE